MSLLKKLIKLLFWLAGLSVIAIVAVVILVTTIDPNEHKGWIEARFQKETGRSISLDGPIAFTFYPWLGVEASEVSIANVEEFGDEPFAYLEYVKLRVKSLPLLREEYEVDTIAVSGAVINLVRNEQGIANWDGRNGATDAADDEAAAKRDKPMLPLAAVALGGVAVEDARVTLDDRQEAVRYEVSDLDVSTAELKYGEPIDINLSFRGKSDRPALDATVALAGIITYATDAQRFAVAPLDVNAVIRSGNIPGGETSAKLSAALEVNLDAATVALADFTLSALGATVKGNLSAQQIDSPAPAIAATLDTQGADLGLLFKVAEVEPLATQLARLPDRSFRVSATVDTDLERGDIDLSGLSINLLGAAISGEVKARNIHSDTPGYQGELNARGPDLPTLMQVFGQLQAGKDAALAGYGKKLAGIPVKAFRLTTAFDADLKRGDVSVPTLSLEALGINVTGALDAKDMNSRKGTVEGNLNIKGGRIGGLLTALDQDDLAQVLQSVELDTRVRGTRAGVVLEPMVVQAVFAGKDIPGSPATLTLNADARLDLDKETLVLDRFTLDGLGLKSAGHVEFNNIFVEPAASGKVEVLPFNLRRLAQQLKQELPLTKDDNAFAEVSLAGRFEHSATGLNLDQLELQLDDTRLTGEFRMTDEAPKSFVQFDLKMDELNLDRYLPPESKKNNSEGAVLAIAAVAATDLDGSLSVDRLIMAKARMDGFRLGLKAEDGVLQADPVTAALYEGRLSGSVNLDVNPAIPKLTLNLGMTDIQAEPLLMDMRGNARLRGKGSFTATLTARGDSIAAMIRSLDGPMSMSFTEGAVAGFNLGRALRQWKQFREGVITDLEEEAATDFAELSGNPIAKDGVIRLDDLILKAPVFRLQGAGVLADLHSNSIDYQAQAAVVNTSKDGGGKFLAELAGIELPVNIYGTLDNPKIKLAWENILAGLLIDEVLDRLDFPLRGTRKSEDAENEAEADEDSEFDPLKELLKEGLKEGLKGIFKKN